MPFGPNDITIYNNLPEYDEWECEECGDLVPLGMECNCSYDYDYEDDGQPDEAQEWYDFDPDC